MNKTLIFLICFDDRQLQFVTSNFLLLSSYNLSSKIKLLARMCVLETDSILNDFTIFQQTLNYRSNYLVIFCYLYFSSSRLRTFVTLTLLLSL